MPQERSALTGKNFPSLSRKQKRECTNCLNASLPLPFGHGWRVITTYEYLENLWKKQWNTGNSITGAVRNSASGSGA